MDFLAIREEALIEASRLQRRALTEGLLMADGPKELAAGQRVGLEGREFVVQTARNYGLLAGRDPERTMAAFRRHPGAHPPVWLVRVPETLDAYEWELAMRAYGGPIPPAGLLSAPLPVALWVGDRFSVEDMSGLVYLSADGPSLLVAAG